LEASPVPERGRDVDGLKPARDLSDQDDERGSNGLLTAAQGALPTIIR
jgi:hypothetical protein